MRCPLCLQFFEADFGLGAFLPTPLSTTTYEIYVCRDCYADFGPYAHRHARRAP